MKKIEKNKRMLLKKKLKETYIIEVEKIDKKNIWFLLHLD